MGKLAIHGGDPVRTAPWPTYPVRGEDEVEAAARVVRGGGLAAHHGTPYQAVERFEEAFAAYNGVPHCVGTSNGTTALHVALAAAGVGAGDEVIVPAYTFMATATCVLQQMAVPVFADIEPDTLGLDPDCVRRAITPRTKAIIPVHMNGYPCDMDALMAVAHDHRLFVVEDCSHAHGATHRGRKVGTIGDVGAFSFQQKKNLSLGEGGALITADEGIAERSRGFRSWGHDVPMTYNYRMSEIHAAIGQVRVAKLDAMNAQRVRNAAYLDEHLVGLAGLHPLTRREGTTGVYYNYIVQHDADAWGVSRQAVVSAVQAEGIPASGGYTPVYRHPIFQTRNAYGRGAPFEAPFHDGDPPRYDDGTCPVCEAVCDRLNLEVKIHPPADEADMADVVAAFRKVVEHIDDLRT